MKSVARVLRLLVRLKYLRAKIRIHLVCFPLCPFGWVSEKMNLHGHIHKALKWQREYSSTITSPYQKDSQ